MDRVSAGLPHRRKRVIIVASPGHREGSGVGEAVLDVAQLLEAISPERPAGINLRTDEQGAAIYYQL